MCVRSIDLSSIRRRKTIVKNFSIPSLAPSGSYTAKLNNDQNLIACYSVEFELH
jgi:hypothetical protein